MSQASKIAVVCSKSSIIQGIFTAKCIFKLVAWIFYIIKYTPHMIWLMLGHVAIEFILTPSYFSSIFMFFMVFNKNSCLKIGSQWCYHCSRAPWQTLQQYPTSYLSIMLDCISAFEKPFPRLMDDFRHYSKCLEYWGGLVNDTTPNSNLY